MTNYKFWFFTKKNYYGINIYINYKNNVITLITLSKIFMQLII